MASEYYKKKFQDVKPDVQIELTKKEKWNNWWYYHWLHVLITVGAVVLLCVLILEWCTRIRPDYKIAIVSESYFNADIVALEEQIAKLAPDVNGDDKVIVQIRSYITDPHDSEYTSNMVGLSGDIGVGGSSIYILEDSSWFIGRYNILMEENCYAWEDCPALSHIDLGGAYDIALRTDAAETDAVVLWNAMTAGAE